MATSPYRARSLSVVWRLDVLIVPISEVEIYEMYAMIGWERTVCPFYGGCPLLEVSVFGPFENRTLYNKNEKHLKMNKEVGMLLQEKANTSGVGIIIRRNLYYVPPYNTTH